MNAPIYLTLSAFLLLLSGCSGQSTSSDQSALAPSHAAMTCDSPEVEKNAAQKLVEWLKEKIVDNGNGNLHLNGDLQSNISTSVSIGELPPTQQCLANVTLGFKDAGGTLHTAEPVSIRFNFSPAVIELNEASLLQDGGAFASTSFLLVAEDERETAASAQASSLPGSSGAEDFERVPYALTKCTKDGCIRATSITSVSAKACAYSLEALNLNDDHDLIDGRLYPHNDRSRWYECDKLPPSS